jgi:hypothetical protein
MPINFDDLESADPATDFATFAEESGWHERRRWAMLDGTFVHLAGA